jgi:23S rRNA pseudouridine1911/1915/1917 synthase
MPELTSLVALDDGETQRVDLYVASLSDGINRSKLKNGAVSVCVNGKEAKLSSKVKNGDSVIVKWEETVPRQFEPENIPLDIIYEDTDVTVVNKKQGMVTHPAAGNWSGTLVNALLYHWGQSGIATKENVSPNLQRYGIVHRLDKDTSGVLITARNEHSAEYLCAQFYGHRVKKEYIAIVCGRPPAASGKIKTNIVRDRRDRKRFIAIDDKTRGKAAYTAYRCIACYGPFSLLRLRLKTGRTHQIRVHLKYLGCPVLGDPVYGEKNKVFPNATLMLHSRLLAIRLDGENFTEFKAEVPNRFKKVLKVLHSSYKKCVLT